MIRRDCRPSVKRTGKGDFILIGHGAGGLLTRRLVERLFLPRLGNPALNRLEDSAILDIPRLKERLAGGGRLAFTTDAFVVKPPFFPGGDIGRLSVCGTVNDLAAAGAQPAALSASIILEEGFPMEKLEKIVESMRRACLEAGVVIAAGDTKVVEKGEADGIFISTSGIGVIDGKTHISSYDIDAGDSVLISGKIGMHGVAVLSARGGLGMEGSVESDCAPLNGLVAEILKACPKTRAMRDPTRGGLATTLVEMAEAARVRIEIAEKDIPVGRETDAACRLLGLDPLYLANEGKMVVFVPGSRTQDVLKAMRKHPLGKDAMCIGKVTAKADAAPTLHRPRSSEKWADAGTGSANKKFRPEVIVHTDIGGQRPLMMLESDPLPRIC